MSWVRLHVKTRSELCTSPWEEEVLTEAAELEFRRTIADSSAHMAMKTDTGMTRLIACREVEYVDVERSDTRP